MIMLPIELIKVPESTLPLSIEQIQNNDWDGVLILENYPIIATIRKSQIDDNYDCRVIWEQECSATKESVPSEFVGFTMDSLLSYRDFTSNQFKWKIATDYLIENEIVYFLRAGEYIKIGKSSVSVYSRVNQLMTGCPFPIKIIKTISGGYKEERELHRKFAHIRAHGEWFHATEELITFIASLEEK